MSKIKLLSPELINQIAAGEVVERPASVVKELVENSIDAGASNIVIEIENGGLNLIKITDDGCGMDEEDARNSIIQHATSKVRTQDDLYNINTLGFRGEALASIASVSEFELLTREKDSVAGTQVAISRDEVKVAPIGCAAGTAMIIRNLFYNVPARQKYLKTAATEFNHITDLFINFALAYPQLNWKLVHNGKPVYQFSSSAWRERVTDVLGAEIGAQLIEVNWKMNDLQFTGFIGRPQISRNNRKLQYLFINSRPVNEFIVAKQVKDAYSTLIPRDLYPVYLLNMQIHNDKVDVNVHPRKLEVRFSEPQIVYKTVYQIVAKTLDDHDLTKDLVTPAKEVNEFQPIQQVLSSRPTFASAASREAFSRAGFSVGPMRPTELKQAIGLAMPMSDAPADLPISLEPTVTAQRIVGQIHNSYILVETAGGLRIYDQHAASERIRYESFRNQWQIGKLASQRLLIPQNIELAPTEMPLVAENAELFFRLGFEVNDIGGNTLMVSSVPQFLLNENLRDVLMELIGVLPEVGDLNDEITPAVDKVLKSMSCKGAIKFGDSLTLPGMEALIRDLDRLPAGYTCVHGRPAMIDISLAELGKFFYRN